MKQGDQFLKIVAIVLACMAALYFLISILNRPDDGYTTYTAALYEVGDGISTSGFVVRDEQVVTSSESIIALTRSEGERVAKGETIANCYNNAEAQSRQLEIDALAEQLSQLEYAYSFAGSDAEASDLDAQIVEAMTSVASYVNRRSLAPAAEQGEQLKSYILRRYVTDEDTTSLWDRITALKTRLNNLYTQANAETSHITASTAGYFSGTVDGYESILTMDFLERATVGDVQALADTQTQTSTDEIGKLVLSARWYLITQVDTAVLGGCNKGDVLTVHFAHDFYNDVRMCVARISEDENGKSVVVLYTDDYIQDAVSLREQTVELLFDDITGLRVPKKAIYVNEDGESGVYVLEAAEAKWKTVKVLCDGGSTYLVALDKSSTDNLWPEDEIILTDREIYNGKVMGQ